LALLFRTIDALKVFDLVFVMTQEARQIRPMFAIYGYKSFAEGCGYGSAIAVVVFLISWYCRSSTFVCLGAACSAGNARHEKTRLCQLRRRHRRVESAAVFVVRFNLSENPTEISAIPPVILPKSLHWDNYRSAIDNTGCSATSATAPSSRRRRH
jgi:hypothetical protein